MVEKLRVGEVVSIATKAIKQDGATMFVKGRVVHVSRDSVEMDAHGKSVVIQDAFIGSVLFDDEAK